MKIGQYKMANEWMREESALPEEALNTWNEMEAEFKANRAMSQEPRIMEQAALVDELEPGPLKDEMLGKFNPDQETYEEYLQRINLERPFNMNQGGIIGKPGGVVEPGVMYYGKKVLSPPDNWEGTKEEWNALDRKKRFRFRNPGGMSDRSIGNQYKGKNHLPKVREYLRKVFRKKDSITFDDLSDLKKKAGVPDTAKIESDISRLINTKEFKGKVSTKMKDLQLGQTERFRNILRDIKNTLPKGKKQFVNVSYLAKKHKLPGKYDAGSYYRILQEPEFKNTFVGLTTKTQSNPRIIRFAEEFEKLYNMQDIDRNTLEELSKNIYGDTSKKSMAAVKADAARYAEFLYGVRGGYDQPKIIDADGKQLKMPSVEKRGDYLFELIDETVALEEGEKGKVKPLKFGTSEDRLRMLAIRDGLIGNTPGQTESQRLNIKKLLKKGYNLDEVAGLSATHEIAPGYTELVQGVKAKINANKLKEIDQPFSRIFEQVITGEKPTKGFQYGKDKFGKPKFYQDINEVVKLYNKDAAAYGKKYNIDVPLIEYDPRPGKKLNPKNFLPNFKYLSPGAKANVKELAKKGIGVRTGAFTMGQLESKNLNVSPKEQMKILKKMGYRCAKASGAGETLECYLDDVEKTKAEARKGNVDAMTKQRKAFNIGKNIKNFGKLLRRGVQGVIGGVGTAIGGKFGLAIEGAIEGGVYDYYRKQGYSHEQALQEGFVTKAIDPKNYTGLFSFADELIEKEKIGTRWDPSGRENLAAKYADAKSKYDAALDKYNKIQSQRPGTLEQAEAQQAALAEQEAIIQALESSVKVGTPEYEAYQQAEERQAALMDERARDYKSKNRFLGLEWDLSPAQIKQKTPSDFKEKQMLKQREREMDEYKKDSLGKTLKAFSLKPGESFNWDAMGFGDEEGIKDKWQKLYEAGGIDLLDRIGIAGGVANMAGGGIASIRRPHAIPPKSGPTPQGLPSMYNRVKRI